MLGQSVINVNNQSVVRMEVQAFKANYGYGKLKKAFREATGHKAEQINYWIADGNVYLFASLGDFETDLKMIDLLPGGGQDD